MKRLMDIKDRSEQRAVVDGFARFFRHYTRDPWLRLWHWLIRVGHLSEHSLVPLSTLAAFLILFFDMATLVLPIWHVVGITSGFFMAFKDNLYERCFRNICKHAGPFSIEEYFALRGELDDDLKQRLAHFKATGRASHKQTPAEVYIAFRKWCRATGHNRLEMASLVLILPTCMTIAAWYVLVPVSLLMMFFQVSFFEMAFWITISFIGLSYMLLHGFLYAMKRAMKKTPLPTNTPAEITPQQQPPADRCPCAAPHTSK